MWRISLKCRLAKHAVGIIAILIVLLASSRVNAQSKSHGAFSLTKNLLLEGMRLLPRGLVNLNVVNLDLTIEKLDVNFAPQFNFGGGGSSQIQEQLAGTRNDILRKQLMVMKARLDADIERNKLLAAQTKSLQAIGEHQMRLLQYTKERDQDLMRKTTYDVPLDKLIVVVADFSSSDQLGQETADEIASHLQTLKSDYGIDMHVLVGEIKPGIVIRSAEMAADLGRHFPPHTNFVVIWGTLSPRTVGKFRPHITCVQKLSNDRGVAASFSLPLQSEELPLSTKEEVYRRQCHERLIGTVCAAIPSCYAANEIKNDRVPKLEKFYASLGSETNQVKGLQKEIGPLIRWSELKENAKKHLNYIRRVSPVSKENAFPKKIINLKDNGLMLLILSDDNQTAKTFRDPDTGKKCLVYVDMLEVTHRQYLQFLEGKTENKAADGKPWFKDSPAACYLTRDKTSKKFLLRDPHHPHRKDCSMDGVSWRGAFEYCQWAGKSLPTKQEWQTAVRHKDKGNPYPWGNDSPRFIRNGDAICSNGFLNGAKTQLDGWGYQAPTGFFLLDRSSIGCFDMAGNVAEWCLDWHNQNNGERVVCGGSYKDDREEAFRVTFTRGVHMSNYEPHIGFRGVLRIPLPEENK